MGLLVAFAIFVLIAGLVLWAYSAKRTSSVLADDLTRRLEIVQYMSGREFEHFTSDVLQGLGYRTTILGGSGDQGVDVIARGGGKEIAIQCKNYDRPVGNRPVQEVYAGAHHHGCTDMWVIAPKGFTKGAIGLAQNVGVSLYDYAALRSWTRLTSGLQNDVQFTWKRRQLCKMQAKEWNGTRLRLV